MSGAPLRLTFVCAARRWTGGEHCMVTVANGLAARGHDVVFAYDPRGPVGERIGSAVRAVPVVVRNDADLVAVGRLARLMRRQATDVACVNTFRELKVGGAAARLAGRVRVVNRRGAVDPLYGGIRERLLYRLLLDVVVRDSRAGCRAIREANPWFRGPVLHARNGVDAVRLGAVEPMPREAFGARPDEVLVAIMDRPGRRWGSPDLAAACVRAVADDAEGRLPPLRLAVFGRLSTEAEAVLRGRLDGVGDRVRVSLLGPRPSAEALRIVKASDIFARVSWTDALSYAVLEAMALGVPVLASDVGGLPEAVVDGETGVLVPVGDVPALARALTALAVDPAARRRMGRAGRDRVALEFRESQMLDEYEAAFRFAANGR